MSPDKLPSTPDQNPPLCVDLDGTLVKTDTFFEALLMLFRSRPMSLLALPAWCLGGKAHLKRQVSSRINFDAAHLPLHR